VPGIDLTGYRSASLFDFAYFVFMILLIPSSWSFIREKTFSNYYLLFWAPAVILIPVLYVYLRPSMPYLTPSYSNVIDTRYFIIHFSVTVGVTIFLTRVDMENIIKGSYVFYSIIMVCFLILSVLALKEFSFFYFHYPFLKPFAISFPFPSQNVAAPFITVCLLGFLGTVIRSSKLPMIVLALPVGFLAAALTGSRSNMVLLIFSIATYLLLYFGISVAGRRNENAGLLVGVAWAVGAVAITCGILTIHYDWRPVRRAFSIFELRWVSVGSLSSGGPSSPRKQMWTEVLSQKEEEDEETGSKRETYKMYMLSVEDGEVSRSREIVGLNTGETYYVRLNIEVLSDGSQQGTLGIFANGDRQHPIGITKEHLSGGLKRDLFVFVSDTGNDRGLVTIDAWLDNYKIKGGNDEIRLSFSDEEGLDWYEEWYREKFGDAHGVIRSNKGRLELVAYEQAIRAYVEKQGILDLPIRKYSLEYEVVVDKLEPVIPMEGPARFYVGFHGGRGDDLSKDWNEISNAILIAHERMMTDYEYRVLLDKRWLGLTGPISTRKLPHRLPVTEKGVANEEQHELHRNSAVKIQHLWQSDIRGAQFSREGGIKGWSLKRHLAKRGSMHNVYFDWYYYVGILPFVLFLLFKIFLIAAFTTFVWKRRKSPYSWFYVATGLQIIVISGSMYAHPGIWTKYIWFVYGIAGGLMLSQEQSIEDN